MSDKIGDALCYSVGSAYLSGLPVVVAGYQMLFDGFLSKVDFMERAIENAKLQPEDVIIALGSDTIFTGADLNPFLDRFIAQSAATPEKLDALAVRQGRAMAPVLFNGEISCWAANAFDDWYDCKPGYEDAFNKVREYAVAHPEHELSLPFDLVPQCHLSSGSVVARVWAYREYIQAAIHLRIARSPLFLTERGWFCDQAVSAALYLNLMTWEVEGDVFSMPLPERQAARSPNGVRAGFLGLDYSNEFSVFGAREHIHQSVLHDEHWVKYLPVDKSENPHTQRMTNFVSIGRFVGDLYKRAYAAHGEGIYTRLAVPMWVEGKRASGAARIALTPPLLALKPRPIDMTNNTTHNVFPVIFHSAGTGKGAAKVKRMEYGAISARWLVPMAHDTKAKRQAMEYLASVPLFLSTNNSIIRDSYHAKCGFPFERTIEKLKGL
ncbi:unnamed protein product [Phytomonas sp. EM1]|nr:unnamed protein product [Phytomonas sp. EM1]|eukprot:CCW64901.1 unnamed protein product [Phytomonas sp. isolate EM1]